MFEDDRFPLWPEESGWVRVHSSTPPPDLLEERPGWAEEIAADIDAWLASLPPEERFAHEYGHAPTPVSWSGSRPSRWSVPLRCRISRCRPIASRPSQKPAASRRC